MHLPQRFSVLGLVASILERLGGLTFRRLKDFLFAFVFSTLLFCVRHLITHAKLFQAHHARVFHAAEE
jgi:hypothetical protein